VRLGNWVLGWRSRLGPYGAGWWTGPCAKEGLEGEAPGALTPSRSSHTEAEPSLNLVVLRSFHVGQKPKLMK